MTGLKPKKRYELLSTFGNPEKIYFADERLLRESLILSDAERADHAGRQSWTQLPGIGATTGTVLAQASVGRVPDYLARLRAERDRIIQRLREEDPKRWSYSALAAALGCSRELIAVVARRTKPDPEPEPGSAQSDRTSDSFG